MSDDLLDDDGPAHARLSPSGADRWMVCPASVRASEHIPEERSSEYAAEGTCAHEVRAKCLEDDEDPYDFVGSTLRADGFEFVWSEEDAAYLTPGIDKLREMTGRMVVEYRVDLGRWLPGQFGTLDCGIIAPDVIRINDLKYGQGEKVSPVRNRQMMIYALGFWDNVARHETSATRFILSIDQPRAGGWSEWELTLDELLAFGEEVRVAGKRVDEPDAEFCASEKGCRWCRVKNLPPKDGSLSGCATHDAWMLDIIEQKLDDVDDGVTFGEEPRLPTTNQLSAERRSYIVQHAKIFEKWLARLHADTLTDALIGNPTPGLKAVLGQKGDRKWVEPKDDLLGSPAEFYLVDALSDDAFNKKLKSPAQAEKLLRPRRGTPGNPDAWERLTSLITQDDGKPVLVPESDEREALMNVHDKLSDDEDDDTDDFDLLA